MKSLKGWPRVEDLKLFWKKLPTVLSTKNQSEYRLLFTNSDSNLFTLRKTIHNSAKSAKRLRLSKVIRTSRANSFLIGRFHISRTSFVAQHCTCWINRFSWAMWGSKLLSHTQKLDERDDWIPLSKFLAPSSWLSSSWLSKQISHTLQWRQFELKA